MQHASLILPFLSAALMLASCATNDASVAEDALPTETQPQESTTVPPTTVPATTPPPPAEKQCVPSCTTDADCQNSCPAVAGGVQCCDPGPGKCYATAQAVCPKPQEDAGTPPPAY